MEVQHKEKYSKILLIQPAGGSLNNTVLRSPSLNCPNHRYGDHWVCILRLTLKQVPGFQRQSSAYFCLNMAASTLASLSSRSACRAASWKSMEKQWRHHYIVYYTTIIRNITPALSVWWDSNSPPTSGVSKAPPVGWAKPHQWGEQNQSSCYLATAWVCIGSRSCLRDRSPLRVMLTAISQ